MAIPLFRKIFQRHALAVAVSMLTVQQAGAFTFEVGEVEGAFDSTLSIGASWARRGADPDLVGGYGTNIGSHKGSVGKASSNTGDDGRLNFKKGETFSKIFKGLHDFELKYGDSGMFLRGNYWYDFELKDESRLYHDIDDSGRKTAQKASGYQLLDAFIYHNYFIGEQPGTVRLGKQVVSWGESTFIGNSINSINPIDVSAFRRPGSELKEALIPVNMVYLSQSLNDSFSAEAFYQLEWDQTVLDNCGTFFGSDVIAEGCDTRLEAPVPGVGRTYLQRGADKDARDGGQYGLAVRWFSEELNNTEFAAYMLNYHSRTPILSGTSAKWSAFNPGSTIAGPGEPDFSGQARFVSSGSYFLEYPEDIRLYGLTFATMLNTTSVSGELSYRPNMPLALNTSDTSPLMFFGGLANKTQFIGNSLLEAGFIDPPSNAGGDYIQGYQRKPVTQGQMTMIHFVDQVLYASRLTLVGEVGVTHIADLGSTDGSDLRFGRSPVFGSGAVVPGLALTCEGLNSANPEECNDKGFYTQNSWGYRVKAQLDYPNVFAGVNLKPSLSWSHDVDGYGPTFNEGNKAYALGLDADYRNTYTASLSYVDFFGGDYNSNIDRDFVSLSFGVNF